MIADMAGKRDAHERLPELIAAAVRVFTREGYRLARMSDVAAEMGLSEAAIYRYVGSKEGLFVLAIRHALLLEDLPAGDLPLRGNGKGAWFGWPDDPKMEDLQMQINKLDERIKAELTVSHDQIEQDSKPVRQLVGKERNVHVQV